MRKKVGVVRKAFLAVYSTNSFIGLSRMFGTDANCVSTYIYGYQRTSFHSPLARMELAQIKYYASSLV